MKLFKNILLICLCVLLAIFQPLARKKEKEELVLKEKERDEYITAIIDNIVNTTDKADGSPKLYNIDIIKQMITDEKLVKKLDNYKITGCFNIGNGKIEYQNVYCDRYIFDESISSNPIMLDGMLAVYYSNGALTKVNIRDWYDYSKEARHFAYAVTTNKFFYENKRVYYDDYDDLYIWIPAFYYNEDTDIISLKSFDEDADKIYEHTTPNHLLNAFMYKNSELYGFWVQLTTNKLDKINNSAQVDVHPITEDEKYALKMFERYYTINNYFSNLDNLNVISIGKEVFFDETH